MADSARRSKAQGYGDQETDQSGSIPDLVAAMDPANPQYTLTAAFYWGPIPLPAILEGYENVAPGSAEKIISNAMAQSDHRRNLELINLRGNERRANIGLYLGGA